MDEYSLQLAAMGVWPEQESEKIQSEKKDDEVWPFLFAPVRLALALIRA